MQHHSLFDSRPGLFGLGAFFRQARPSIAAAPAPVEQVAEALGIPSTFTQEQAEWVLALHRLASHDKIRALQILDAFAGERCSAAQAGCIEALLDLDEDDLRATLVDAMEEGELRRRLRAKVERLAQD